MSSVAVNLLMARLADEHARLLENPSVTLRAHNVILRPGQPQNSPETPNLRDPTWNRDNISHSMLGSTVVEYAIVQKSKHLMAHRSACIPTLTSSRHVTPRRSWGHSSPVCPLHRPVPGAVTLHSSDRAPGTALGRCCA
jgi:hypothetical protein